MNGRGGTASRSLALALIASVALAGVAFVEGGSHHQRPASPAAPVWQGDRRSLQDGLNHFVVHVDATAPRAGPGAADPAVIVPAGAPRAALPADLAVTVNQWGALACRSTSCPGVVV